MPSCALAFIIAACSSPGEAVYPLQSDQSLELKDQKYLEELQEDFLVVSGKDYVEFEKGSSKLSPSAKFRIERQALWLLAYSNISVRLVAGGDGAERISDRRLAMERGRSVRNHLIETGVSEQQIGGIHIAETGNDRQRVTTRIDPFQSGV